MADRLHFREYAGVLTAFVVVLSYVGIGFVQTAVVVGASQSLEMPKDWMAAMLSLASAALGFLIGKQGNVDNIPPGYTPGPVVALPPTPAPVPPAPETALPAQPAAATVPKP